jgi:hypothetical protein
MSCNILFISNEQIMKSADDLYPKMLLVFAHARGHPPRSRIRKSHCFSCVSMSLKKKDRIHCWYLTHSAPPPPATPTPSTHDHRPEKIELIHSWFSAETPTPPHPHTTIIATHMQPQLAFLRKKTRLLDKDSDWLVGYSY